VISPADLSRRLPELIDEIREAGYAIGIEQYVASQDLLLALAGQGALPDDPARYSALLGPILCKSAREQEDFRVHYDRWIARGPASPKRNAAEELRRELNEVERGARYWRWALLGGAVVTLTLVGFLLFRPRPNSSVTTAAANAPNAGANIDASVEPIPSPAAFPDIAPNAEPAAQELTREPPGAPPVRRSDHRVAALYTALSLLVVGLVGWKLWWVRRARQFLSQKTISEFPDLARVSVRGAVGELFRDFGLARMAQRLRHRRPVASGRIDVQATVQNTVRNGGWFTPVMGHSLIIPEYLVLVDRSSHHDHQARFFDELINRLEQDEVIVSRYEFDNDPRICHPTAAPADTETIRSLAARYQGHRLLIISRGTGLISPMTGEVAPWVDQFGRWSERVLLTPESADHWGDCEQLLAQHGFLVLPATDEGLTVVGDASHARATVGTSPSRSGFAFPELLRERPRRWLEPNEPTTEVLSRMLRELRDYLGRDSYEWLAACAIYPALHWDLTIYLGHSLRTEQGYRLLDPNRLASLARLPWFRHGSMPNWLRSALIKSLPEGQEQHVRATLQALLLTAAEGEAAGDNLVLEIARAPRDILAPLAKQVFRALRRRAADDSPLRDYAFASYMTRRRASPLLLELPTALTQAFRTAWRRSAKVRMSRMSAAHDRAASVPALVRMPVTVSLRDFARTSASAFITLTTRSAARRPWPTTTAWLRVGVDVSAGVLLAAALLLIRWVDAPRPVPENSSNIQTLPITSTAPVASRLRLAVTPKQYDDMGKLLDQLGSGFAYTQIPLESLEDGSKLADYDVVFFTCGTDDERWLTRTNLGKANRPGVPVAKWNEEVLDRIREALRAFVGRGGTLYASDWRLNLIHLCFPELFGGEGIFEGTAQTVLADVVDDGLREYLGTSKVELNFDLPGWKPARFAAGKATIYLRGDYRPNTGGDHVTAPLLVKVPFERGTIIFTSFHNEKVNTELETELLRFLVFAAVTAKETVAAQKSMISGGFSPQKESLLSTSGEAQHVTSTYKNDKRRPLRFVLSFASQGARLALSVRGPNSETYQQEGASTFTVDVPDAAPGDWSYTVTPRKLPFPNFPFSLSVGGK
jgi:hypothetical protein